MGRRRSLSLNRRMPYAQAFFAIFLLAVAIVPEGVSLELSPSLPLLSFHRFLLLINCGVFAFSAATKHSMVRMGNMLDKTFLLYLAAIVPSILLSFDRTSSLKHFFSEIVLMGIIVAYMSFHLVKDEQDAQRLVSWIVLVGIMAALIGIGEALFGYDYKQQEIYRQFNLLEESRLNAIQGALHARSSLIGATGRVRVESDFGHPIVFGSFLVLLFPSCRMGT